MALKPTQMVLKHIEMHSCEANFEPMLEYEGKRRVRLWPQGLFWWAYALLHKLGEGIWMGGPTALWVISEYWEEN